MRDWLIHLCDLKDIKIDHTTFRSSVLRIKEKRFYCNQHQKKEELEIFMSETLSLPGQSSNKKKSFDYGDNHLNKSFDKLDINYMYVKECGITVTCLLDIIRKSEDEFITLADALKLKN